jgi:lipopolysaccharide export system protein LptA
VPKTGRLELEGNVVVEQLSRQRSGEEGVLDTTTDDEAKRLLASRIVLSCDRMVILTEQRLVQAEGAVRVIQEGRSAFAAAAVFSDRDRRLILTGSVMLQEQDGNGLRADKVLISLTDETLEASGNVITEFILTRK